MTLHLAPPKRIAGFTLLEAIVAMALLGAAGMALYSWLNTSFLTLSRVQDANLRTEATRNILAYMEANNPMLQASGEEKMSGYNFSWQAKPLAEPRQNANYPFGTGLYQIGMYETTVDVRKSDGTNWFSFKIRQVGHKKTLEFRLPF